MNNHDSLPIFIEETDHKILMHKAVHFNDSFPIMLAYYQEERKGVQEEFDLERIEDLFRLEQEKGISLSALLLDEEEQKEIEKAKEKYAFLKGLYHKPSSAAQKLADIILSEEEEPLDAIMELCSLSTAAVPALISVLKEDDFYNPLFPGYGLAPAHACQCLGMLKDKKAIIPLFEALPRMEFFGEEAAVQALFEIGTPAKEFLISAVTKTPFTKENENAAIALLPFKNDPLVVDACLDLLENPLVAAKVTLFTYLLLICEGVTDPRQIERIQNLAKQPLAPSLREEIDWIIRSCNKK